jgi:murein L,D-transpeptidase YafK
MASAAVAATIALAGCNPDSIAPTGRAQAPLSEKTLAEIEAKHMEKESPILVRIFKEEAEMEVWKQNRDGQYALLKTYPICRWSGDLGPKKKEGDRQAPEGFYTITPGHMNPNSNYYLAFNTGYPNAYDRAWGYTGSELMVHGDCSSRGCYAMTDEQMQEIYALARESFFGGQKAFQLQAYPFRMTALNMAKHRNNKHFAFWKMLKEGYDHFEVVHREPKVAVCEQRYVFDAAAPENASRPLSFNPKGKCPVYQLDKNVADAVLDRRRREQFQLAEYIARGVSTTPPRDGVDGGMNPVFAAKRGTPDEFDSNSGRTYQVASTTAVPGALPRTPNPPAAAMTQQIARQTASAPVVMASVPMPKAAPLAKEGEAPPEQPKSIAALWGNWFGGAKAEAKPSAPATESDQVALRGSNTELAAKPKLPAPVRAAAAAAPSQPKPRDVAPPKAVADNAPVAAPTPRDFAPIKPKAVADNMPAATPKPRDVVPPKPKAVADNTPATAPKPPVKQADRPETPRAPEREIRTAFAAPPASNNGLLAGAAPVVPVGSFSSR